MRRYRYGVWGLGALLLLAALAWAQSMTTRTDMFNFVNGIYAGNFMTGKALSSTSTGALTIGSTGHTSVAIITDGGTVTLDGTITSAGDVTLASLETISNATNGTITLGRNDAGTLIVTAKDDDATAALTVLPGGAAALTLGGASTTTVTVTTDGTGTAEVALPAGAIDSTEILDGTIANADLATGSFAAITGVGTLTALTVSGTLTLANSETLDAAVNGTITLGRNDAGTVTLTAKDDDATAAFTILPGGAAAFVLGGASTTSIAATTDGGTVTLDGTITFPNAETISNATEGAFILGRNDAGVVTVTCADNDATAGCIYDAGGASPIIVGSADVTNVTLLADTDVTIQNGATGNVTLDFRDYADTTDDDMAHAIFTVNCTDTGTGTEDCDFSIGVVEAGAAAETRFTIDADGGITLGSANNNSVTLTTDGTGDAEVVLPTGAVSAAEILDLTRSFSLPLAGWLNCTDSEVLDFTSGADDKPDFTLISSALTIAYDDTGGTIDADEICTTFTVPQDFVSTLTIAATVTQDAATVTNIEDMDCRVSIDGAALGAVGTAALANQTAVQTVTVTPAGTFLVGSAVSVLCKQSDAAADDIVRIHSIEVRYTASQ